MPAQAVEDSQAHIESTLVGHVKEKNAMSKRLSLAEHNLLAKVSRPRNEDPGLLSGNIATLSF